MKSTLKLLTAIIKDKLDEKIETTDEQQRFRNVNKVDASAILVIFL